MTTTSRLRRRAGLAVPVMLVAGLTLAGCGGDGEGGTASPPTTASPTAGQTQVAASVELTALLEYPERYNGRQVTTMGVASRLAASMLALTPPSGATPGTLSPGTWSPGTPSPGTPSPGTPSPGTATAAANRLIVVYGQLTPPEDGATVAVTGTVQDSFDEAAIEQRLGVTLDRQAIRRLRLGENDVVLIADRMETTSGTPTTATRS